jgi:hypothetical protein
MLVLSGLPDQRSGAGDPLSAGQGGRWHLRAVLYTCPYCRYSVRPRPTFLAIEYCPRCLGRRTVAERLRPREVPVRTLPVVPPPQEGDP